MDITVRLDEQTLRRMLGDVLPITVLLDDERGQRATDGRWIRIGPADHLELLPGEGVRVATSGELRWPVMLAPLMTFTLNELQLLVRPTVVGEGPTTRLLFRPRIEHIDLQRLPSFIDRGILALVNRELEARSQRLAWDVAGSLRQRFPLPDTLIPLEMASVDVVSAQIVIDDRAIELVVSLAMAVTRVGDDAAAAPAVGGGQPEPAADQH